MQFEKCFSTFLLLIRAQWSCAARSSFQVGLGSKRTFPCRLYSPICKGRGSKSHLLWEGTHPEIALVTFPLWGLRAQSPPPYQDGLLGLKLPRMNLIKGLLRDYRVA